jgi:vacuolar-type H+-ATPase subunit I/STV1
MAQVQTQTFLLNLSDYTPRDLVQDSFYRGLQMEFLNPKELGMPWDEVHTLGHYYVHDTLDLELVGKILERTQVKSLLSVFTDNRTPLTPDDLEEISKTQSDWMEVATDIDLYFEIIDQLAELKKYSQKYKNEVVYFGRDIGALGPQFRAYVETLLQELEAKDINIPQSVSLPELSVDQVDQYQAVRLDKDFVELFNDYLKEQKLDEAITSAKDTLLNLEKQKSNLRSALSDYLKNETITTEARKKLSHLHTYLEIQAATHQVQEYIFSLEEGNPAKFLFVSVAPDQLKTFNKFVEDHQLAVEETVWKDEIMKWENPENLKPFQSIAQAVGTIDSKESDPTGVLSIFFMVFFAFCLADAVYGIFISLITGYFLFFTNLKKGFQNIFGLFFFSGLVTTLYGVLTNSWAGDFFVSDIYRNTVGIPVVSDFLANFQVVQILITDEATAEAATLLPVNQVIGETNPIILMMVIALFLGLLNSISAYLLRIFTAVKSKDYGVALATGTWIVFLAALGFTLVSLAFASNLSQIALILLLVAFVAILFFNEATDFVGKILAALFGKYGLYGLVQLAADLVSYTRIVAIGLTGGVIANIVNLMAFLLFQAGGPILGTIMAVLMLLCGHIFNFVLSVFSAYINPLRLTYVEFMPKFYEGRGREFKPVKPEFTYSRLVRQGV